MAYTIVEISYMVPPTIVPTKFCDRGRSDSHKDTTQNYKILMVSLPGQSISLFQCPCMTDNICLREKKTDKRNCWLELIDAVYPENAVATTFPGSDSFPP